VNRPTEPVSRKSGPKEAEEWRSSVESQRMSQVCS